VTSIEQAIELMLGLPAGSADEAEADSVYGRAAARLAAFDRALSSRAQPLGVPPAA
jgi:hypothetical protein